MSNEDEMPEPVTAEGAARALKKEVATIRTWVTRFNAYRLGRVGRIMYYDLKDLRVIEREIHHGHKVPATWQERAAIRLACPLKTQSATAA